MKRLITTLALSLSLMFTLSFQQAWSQFTGCAGTIPTLFVDYSANPDTMSNITITLSSGLGECCGLPTNNNCYRVDLLLHPDSEGISFEFSGATGSFTIYPAPCGSGSFNIGDVICLNGVGPHSFLLCRPGAAAPYTVGVVSYPSPSGTGDVITTEGCNVQLGVAGLDPASITWTSIAPGAPNEWNNLLSNVSGTVQGTSGVPFTGYEDVLVTPQPGSPTSVTYEICGSPVGASVCGSVIGPWCTTSTVTIYPDLFALPGPDVAICNGTVTGTPVTVTAQGGTAPYTYTWTGPGGFNQVNTHGNTTDQVTAMLAGVYNVTITDATGCPAASTSINVVEYFVDIVANPGDDFATCGTPTPTLALNGAVAATNSGIWSGGAGVFNPNNTTLNASYTPTAAEIAAGSVTLTLTPTNTFGCPFTPNNITISLTQFTSVLGLSPSNISCFGANDGAIDLTITPGVPAYSTGSITWSTGANTEDISGLAPGAYSVTVVDVNGCVGTANTTIIEPTQLVASIGAQTNVSCFGGSNGSVTINASGATPGYQYSLNGGPNQGSSTFSGLTAGTYSITVSDNNGCQVVVPVTIAEPLELTSAIFTQTNVSCFGGSNGSVTISAAGGSPDYQFSINGGPNQGSGTYSGLTAGTYNVTVSDLNGCTVVQPVTITQPPVLTTSLIAQTNVSCFGGSNGSVTVSGVGGTPGYSYSLNGGPGQGSTLFSGLSAGNYTVTVTDALGCTANQPVTITEPMQLTSSITAQTNVSCFGGSNGSVTVSGAGATPNYQYSLNGGANQGSGTFTGLTEGTYSITVTDALGCTVVQPVIITEPTVLTSSITAQTNVSCFGGSNGSVTIAGDGATPVYQYSMDGGPIQGSGTFSGLTAGTYSVTVTDALGCTIVQPVTITEPPVLTQTITSPTFTGGWNVSCNGASDGSIDLTINGGTPGYTYVWSNGATTQDLSGISAGTYDVTVTDALGCTIPATITLTEPLVLTQTISAATFTGGWNVSCNGASDGSIDLTIGGGTPGYTYVWNTGATTEDISGLPAGTYDVTATDANGCAIPATITLTEPPVLTQIISAATYVGGWNISCNGASDGSIDLTIGGGTPGYTYTWNTGATTEDISGLPAGTYDVVATDANGCTIPATITLTEPPILTTGLTPSIYPGGGNVSGCNDDGSIDLEVNGGTAPYTYLWSNGATTQDLSGLGVGGYSVTVTDANGCIILDNITLTAPDAVSATISADVYAGGWNVSCNGASDGNIDLNPFNGSTPYTYLWNTGATTEDLSNVPAGNYSVTVTDANGCDFTIGITLTEPPVLTQTISAATFTGGWNVSCNGASDGSIDLTIGGGTPGYTYVWNTGATTEDITGLPAGTYDVVATDANGCTIPATITLTEPPVLTQTISAATFTGGWNVSCNGASDGSIDLTIGGGTPGYTYVWNTGATTEDITGLPAGTYDVVATDANGCTIPATITLTEPPVLTQTISASTFTGGWNVSCNGASDGSIDLTIGGGTPGYTYVWNTGATTEDITGLPAGTYDVVATDANGCTIPATITLTEPPVLTQTISAATFTGGWNVSCNGASDGSIDLTIGGGTPGYTYTWNTGATTEDITGLPAGTYDVVATDANGCTIPATITLTEPPVLTQTISAATYTGGWNVSCNGASDGSIDLTIGGGTPGYTYTWNTGATTEDISGLPAGTYDVVATDANGCTIPATITLTEPPVLTNTLTPSVYPGGGNTSGCVDDGSIDLEVNGGTAPYTYVWSNGAVTQDISGIGVGTYTVQIIDANGCVITDQITLSTPDAVSATISADVYAGGWNVSCNGASDGNIDLNPFNGATPYTYLWNTGATTEDLSNVPAGNYSVTVTDANGCDFTIGITLTEPPVLTQTISAATFTGGWNVSCNGASDGSIDLTIGGGTPGYTYVWNTGATTEDITGLPAGTYDVVATDANGCTIPATITLTEPPVLTQTISAATFTGGWNVSCNGASDGSIDLTIGGGTPGYTYVWNTGATTQDLAGIPAGTYNVTATDANGCTIPATITLTEPPVLTQTISAATFTGGWNLSCNGASDGSIDLTIGGGTPGYTYVWNTGATTEDIAGLPAGTYNVTATDANGCTIPATITLTEPPVLTQTISAATFTGGWNVSCNGASDGSIDLTIGGGTPGYTYVWNTGATTEDITGLPAGTYDVVATDANGCTIPATITLTEPPVLTQTISAATYTGGWNVSCNGGSNGAIDLTVGGGTPVYSYTWNNGATTQDLNGVPAGAYNVVVTDANGCQITSNITLTQPTPLVVNPTVTSNFNGWDVSCAGASDGSVFATVNGGTAGYIYSWTNSAGVVISNLPSANNLSAGTYTITITDQNGCTTNQQITVNDPDPIDLNPSATTNYNGWPISCFGATDGGATVTFNGGVAPYNFVWQNSNGQTISTNQSIQNVGAGTYTVIMTDANGCQFTDQITLNQPQPLNSSASVTTNYNGQDISCHNAQDGGITANQTGGTVPYQYTWTNQSGQIISANESVNNIGAGTYNVVVTDANGCQTNSTVTVNQPGPLFADLEALTDYFGMPVSCVGQEDGTIQVDFGGGTAGYTIVWQNLPGSTNQNPLNNIGIGEYVVVIFDANGCQISDQIVLDAHPLPTFSPGTPQRACLGDEVTISCVTDPANTVQWQFSNGLQFNDCAPTNVLVNSIGCINATVTLTSPFGCVNSQQLSNYICIDPLPNPVFTANPYYDVTFIDPTIYFTNMSTGAVSYTWNFGDGTPNSNLESVQHIFPQNGPGQYTVTLIAVSEFGCVDSISMPITINNELIFYVPNAFTPNGSGPNEVFKPVFYSGYDPYDYTLLIFNRWGEIVFESRNTEVGWDGTYGGVPVQDGVYIWKLTVGELENARRIEKIGHVTLIR
jgi:gliding motility-associated-like protein